MENVYLGRQPILDDEGDLVAYEILYRDGDKESHFSDDRFASASVISSVLNKFGIRSLLGSHQAFIKVDEKFLLSDMIFSIPKEFFIFSVLESVKITERVVERFQQLHIKGYQMAINNITLDRSKMQEYSKVFKSLAYFKVNINKKVDDGLKEMISELKANNIKVVGSKIEDTKHYELGKELGCNMFQGYFFSKPNIVENAKYEPTHVNVLKLYNLLITDTNIDEITQEFENNYEITVQLLQFINSGAFHFRNRISSIHHILTLIGRQPLAKWLMLMIYSKSVSKTSSHSPLMLMVKNRTELMENILKMIDPNVKSNMLGEAYFIGVLSLLDTLFSVKLERILEDLNISKEVSDALLYNKGIMGEIYALIRDIEDFDIKAVKDFTQRHFLEESEIKQIILQSMEDVNSFEDSISA